MKRLLALILAAVMVFGMMAGCGNTGNTETKREDLEAQLDGMVGVRALGDDFGVDNEHMVYGNIRYKGMQVLTEPLTLAEYQIQAAAWEIGRAAAPAAQE